MSLSEDFKGLAHGCQGQTGKRDRGESHSSGDGWTLIDVGLDWSDGMVFLKVGGFTSLPSFTKSRQRTSMKRV